MLKLNSGYFLRKMKKSVNPFDFWSTWLNWTMLFQERQKMVADLIFNSFLTQSPAMYWAAIALWADTVEYD